MNTYDITDNNNDTEGSMDEVTDEILENTDAVADDDENIAEGDEDSAAGDYHITGSKYDITVIYACHDLQKKQEGYSFPEQTLPRERIEVIFAMEDDPDHPRKKSMELIGQAQGRLVIMLDESDFFKAPLLKLMVERFCDSGTAFGMPSLIGQHVNRNPEYFSLKKTPRTVRINTDYCQSVFPTELHGLIFEKEKLQEAYQLYKTGAEPEKQMLLHLLRQNPTFLYMGSLVIRYGQPRECDYPYDGRYQSREWYFDPLQRFLLPALEEDRSKNGRTGRFLQCLALHMIHVRTAANSGDSDACVFTEEELAAYTKLCQDIMQYVDEETIISSESNPAFAVFKEKMMDIRLKKRDFSWYPDFYCTPNGIQLMCGGLKTGNKDDLAVRLLSVEGNKGNLEISGDIDDCFSDEQGEWYVWISGEKYPVLFQTDSLPPKCIGDVFSAKKTFHVSVNLPVKPAERKLEFHLLTGNMEYRVKHELIEDEIPKHTDPENANAENADTGNANPENADTQEKDAAAGDRINDIINKICDITVIYACHDPQKLEEGYDLPQQTFPQDRIEVIRVLEDDLYHPRKRSMELVERARGRFVIMLDESDFFKEPFLKQLLEGFSDSETAFGMPSLIGQHVNRSTEYFSLKKMNRTVRIDTRYCQAVFPTEIHGLIFETERLQEAYRLYGNSVEPEKQILLYLLRQNPTFLYVGSQTVKYGVPRECDYQYDLRCLTREWYFDSLEKFLLPALEMDCRENGSAGRLLQCLALHMIHIRVYANTDNRNKHVVEQEDIDAYTKLYQDIMQYVDEETIIAADSNPTSAALKNKLMDVRLKKRDFSWYPEIYCSVDGIGLMCGGIKMGNQSNLKARIHLIDYKKGRLEIDGAVNDYFSSEQGELYARIGDEKYPVVYNRRYSSTKCFGVTFSKMKTFHVSVKIPEKASKKLLNFYLSAGGMEYQLEYEFVGHTSRFTKKYEYSYWRFSKYMAYWDKDGIHIENRSKKKILKRELKFWEEIKKKKPANYKEDLKLKVVNFLLRPYFSRQKIWLFFDKIYKGGDSSEYMYRYAAGQKDGIKKYYLLDKTSADYKRMVKEGYRPLKRNSLMHRLVFLNANMVIASNSTVFAFNDYTADRSNLIRGDVHFDVACVQHGMSVQKIALAQQRLRDNTKLYFCASKYEIENLSKPAYDYEGYNALHLTGVPRYDGLKDRAGKVLLISPTWRMQSAMPVTKNEGVARDFNPNFKETNYYKVYNSLINDPRLLEAVQKYGYRIQYVLHPIVSPQVDDFERNEYVDIIPAIGDMSYEKVFCESALMVTDFSGVQFDFAYMRKPVVYLHHHDIPQHYEEGTYHYDTMSFGEICHTNDELIDVLIEYMKNDCRMPEMYRKRADDFFEYSDHNNCERIYKIMLEHERNR